MKKIFSFAFLFFLSVSLFAFEASDSESQRLFEAGYDFLNEFEFYIASEDDERIVMAASALRDEIVQFKETSLFKKYSLKDRNYDLLINRMLANANILAGTSTNKKEFSFNEKIRFGTDINQNLLKLNEFNSFFYNQALRVRLYALISLFCFIIAVLILLYIFKRKIVRTKFELQKNQEYTDIVLNAIETERDHISNELHDTIAQELRAIKFEAENSSKSVQKETAESFQKIKELSSKCMAQLRVICYNLLPPDLKLEKSSVQLENLMEFLCQKFNKENHGKIECSFRSDGNLPQIKRQKVLLNVFRIVQEALNNIKIHSKAEFCSIAICRERNFNGVVIYITDDGVGIPKEIMEDGKKMHFGLHSMKSRAESIGAKFSIISEENDGTEIVLKVGAE